MVSVKSYTLPTGRCWILIYAYTTCCQCICRRKHCRVECREASNIHVFFARAKEVYRSAFVGWEEKLDPMITLSAVFSCCPFKESHLLLHVGVFPDLRGGG